MEQSKVIELFCTVGGYETAECINAENPIVELKEEYNLFINTACRCNCGTVLAHYNEVSSGESWLEFKKSTKAKEVARLESIKEIMEKKTYKKEKKAFEKQRDKVWSKIEETDGDIGEIEEKLTTEIMDREDLSMEEKSRLMNEKVYPKINKLMDERELLPERMKAMQAYSEFLQKNQLIYDSTIYELKGQKQETIPMVTMQDFMEEKEDAEIFNYEVPSNCIYDVIDRVKNEDGNTIEKEYDEMKAFIAEVLKHTNEIKIFAFWQDGTDIVVNNRKRITFDELKMEEIVFLKYNELLTITK